jgi:hypothetical protein
MYPTSDSNIVSTTAAIKTLSFQQGMIDSGCVLDGDVMLLLP